jgi:hypothetical protein
VTTTSKYRVCPRCEGEGSVVNPVLSVWTESDRYDDPEGFESMLRGDYDVACPECGGKRVVTEQDEDDYREREQDRRTRDMESGIYPGHPDWY